MKKKPKLSRRKNQHIVPHTEGWAIRAEGASRVTSVHRTQKAAIKKGIKIAKAQKRDLFIHSKNGRIRDRDSYGSDPFPPKDTKH